MRTPICKPGDKATRMLMAEAHHAGRHGNRGDCEVLKYWANNCADCYFELLESGYYG